MPERARWLLDIYADPQGGLALWLLGGGGGGACPALRLTHQPALADLSAPPRQHLAAAAFAAHALPFEVFLLAMLLEEHKRVLRLESLLGDGLNADVQGLDAGVQGLDA